MKHFISTNTWSIEGDGIVIENGTLTVYNRDADGSLVPLFQAKMTGPGAAGWFGMEDAGMGLAAKPTRARVARMETAILPGGGVTVEPGAEAEVEAEPLADENPPEEDGQEATDEVLKPGASPSPVLDRGRPDPDREIRLLLKNEVQRGGSGGVGYGEKVTF